MIDELKPLFAIFTFIFGAVFASFGGVVAFRTPKGQSIVKPDSYCPACKKAIKRYDNIPIISFLILGGRCRYCKERIGVFSLFCEMFGGIGFLFAYLTYGDTVRTLPVMLALFCLVFLFVVMAEIDHESHDVYNVTLLLFGVLAAFVSLYRILLLDASPWDHLGGCALGFLFFLVIGAVAKLLMKREALGSGDVWIVGLGGLLVGAFPLLFAIMLSTLLGSIVELCKIKRNEALRENEIAFAPYLLLGIGAMAIFGDALMNFYWEVLL